MIKGVLVTLTFATVLLIASCNGKQKPRALESYLLSPADMPESGWSLDIHSDIEEPGLCGQPEAQALRGRAEREAVVVLQSPDSNVTVTEFLFQRDESAASALLNEVRQQLSMCREYTATSSHITTRRVLSDLAVPALGDESLAYREMWLDVPLAGDVTANTALYRKRGVVIVMVSTSFDPYGSLMTVIERGYRKASGLSSQ